MIDRAALVSGIARITAAMERDFDALNAADGALGDGDLGVTLTRGMRAITEGVEAMPEDLGLALLACAQAFTKSSGSSYGTLTATGLMAMAKMVKGRVTVDASEVSALVATARDAMQARGKADLGGKTVLDSLDAVARATAGLTDPAAAAVTAAIQAMETFRDKPATIGRSRIFAEKSKGMDDPGMLAMTAIVRAIVRAIAD